MKRKKIYIPTSHLWDHICENICNIIIIYFIFIEFFSAYQSAPVLIIYRHQCCCD